MKQTLKSEHIGSPSSPVLILFGGNPVRRDEVIRDLSTLGDLSIYGTLSEQEGKEKARSLAYKVDLILIGGRYSLQERQSIRQWMEEFLPGVPLTQPGMDYPYSTPAIREDVRKKLNL